MYSKINIYSYLLKIRWNYYIIYSGQINKGNNLSMIFEKYINRFLDKFNYNKKRVHQIDTDRYYMKLALNSSLLSNDPNTKIGSLILNETTKVILSIGYNSIPNGCNNNIEQFPERFDRDKNKYKYFSHAEEAAICICAKNGIKTEGSTIYITQPCCSPCSRMIINSGIKRVVIYNNDIENKDFKFRWKDDIEISKILFKEAGITVTYINKLY